MDFLRDVQKFTYPTGVAEDGKRMVESIVVERRGQPDTFCTISC